MRTSVAPIPYKPLTRERWADFEDLFGARGACGGCWCMWWRLKRSQFERQKGARNRAAMKRLVDSGHVPGILGYLDGKPIAWCAVAPRETFPVLQRSRTLKPIDDRPVWSVVCLFIRKEHRRRGVSVQMLRAAAEYVKKRGGKLVEGYPVEPKTPRMPDAFAWTGITSAFHQAGFADCAKPSKTRTIVRLQLQ